MPTTPFLYSLRDNQLTEYSDSNSLSQPTWISGPQTVPVSAESQLGGLAKFGLGIGAVAGFGYLPIGDKRGWDYITHAIRAVEEYSPGKIFRTFQVSNMLSSLESPAAVPRSFSPELISKIRDTRAGVDWIEHVSRLTGQSTYKLSSEGFRFEKGQLLSGLTGRDVLLERAGVLRSPIGTGVKFQEAYARSLAGGPLPSVSKTFTEKIRYIDELGDVKQDIFMFTGGKSRAQAASRFISGYGTSLIERFNQLARAPFELPVISDLINKLPYANKLNFSVTPSSGLRTLGKLTAKLGLLAPAMYLGYQELDYRTREAEILDNTVFAEGLTVAGASIWTRSQMALSEAADYFGLHAYREKQEEIAPGSTQLSTLLAFPIMGALGATGYGYFRNVGKQLAYREAGLDLPLASRAIRFEKNLVRESLYGDEVPEKLSKLFDKGSTALIKDQAEKELSGHLGRVSRHIAGAQERSDAMGILARLTGKVSPNRLRLLGGAGLGLGLIASFLPGALIPSRDPEELRAFYAGETETAVRRGRHWEFSKSPWEGKRIERFEKSWYSRMFSRPKEKAIWGDEPPSPIERWWKKQFTYDIEKETYFDRPYPLTGGFGEGIPFLGPLISSTIGKLIKPQVLMHEEEWMRQGASGETEALAPSLKWGETVSPGEIPKGAPVSPLRPEGIIGEQLERFKDIVGLPGFTWSAIKEAVTGRPGFFDQEMELESAGRITSVARDFYDRELGGMAATNELFRRMYPRENIDNIYNPIKNVMADWMPGPGEKSLNFQVGDPYSKIQKGEERLPGKGLAALYPELQGVAPADYSAAWRYKILADVAPYSDKFKEAQADVRQAIKRKQLSKEEIALYKQAKEQLKQKKQKKDFNPYLYRDRDMTPMEEILATANENKKIESDEPSWFESVIGSYWETLAHNAETPFEYLTPVSPANKLVHMRTAVEDYERTQVWGQESSFWQHPIRDFLSPFLRTVKHSFGWDAIPEKVQDVRDIESYFDVLKYVKFTRLKNTAQINQDDELVKEYENKRRETLFGINPYTYNFSHIFRSLPRRDRDYFNAFTEADMEERKKILEMIPENEQALLLARWKLKDAADMQKAIKQGLLSEEQVEKAEVLQDQLYEEARTEGMPKTQELWVEYLSTRQEGESYPDWYRRTKLLPEALEGMDLPGPDFVGWNPAVLLEDVKLKIVTETARNMYDFDLWPDRLRAVARRPNIEEAAEQLMDAMTTPEEDPSSIRGKINAVLTANNISANQIAITPTSGTERNTINLQIEEDRGSSQREYIKRNG